MPGREPCAAETLGEREHRVEPNVTVAANTGVGRLAGGVACDERLDHFRPELLAQVDREMRETERVCERSGLGDRRRRAAAALSVVLGI